MKNSGHVINVNVGSGYLTLGDFVNLDNSLFLKFAKSPFYFLIRLVLSKDKRESVQRFADAAAKTDLRLYDCRRAMPFKNNSVTHILCSHFLEHLFHDECYFLLKEFFRVLKPNGSVHIILPDLGLHIQEYISNDNPEAADTLMSVLLAYEKPGLTFRNRLLDITGNFGLHHLWMYDRKSIDYKMQRIGFTINNDLTTPSAEFRKNDGSLHIIGHKGDVVDTKK